MQILLIGGTGFIGAHVARHLVAAGHAVTLFHRGHTKAALPTAVRHLHGDRRDLRSVRPALARLAPDVVIDLILYTEQEARHLVEAVTGVAGRVVGISSQDVYRAYGRATGLEAGAPDPVPLREDAPLRERHYPYREKAKGSEDRLYHYEKILVERVLRDASTPSTILRLPRVYGPGDAQHRLFPYVKRMDDERPAILLEAGAATWRWTSGYVENVAAAIACAATDDRAADRVYNIGEAATPTEAARVERLGRAAGWNGAVVSVKKDLLPEGLVMGLNWEQALVIDTRRIRRELGYADVVSAEEALRRTVAWERRPAPEQAGAVPFDSFGYDAEDAVLAALGWSA